MEIELLTGRVRVASSNVRLSPREFELLVFLAIAAAPVSRETIASAIWPERAGRAVNTLKVTLSRLRSRLGSTACILSTPTGYYLSAAVSLDLDVLLDIDVPQRPKAPANLGAALMLAEVRACRVRIAGWSWARTLHARLAFVEERFVSRSEASSLAVDPGAA